MKNPKTDRNLGDSARGQADPGSAAVYTMDRPGPVICMYVCVATVYRALGPTDPLVVALGAGPPSTPLVNQVLDNLPRYGS